MSLADDTVAILSVWGQTLSVQRKTVSYSATGDPTPTWTEQDSETGMIQPVSGDTIRREVGQDARSTHEIYLPNGTSINEGDRIRPAGWVAGDDEYQVRLVETWSPSHVRVLAVLVEGHGG